MMSSGPQPLMGHWSCFHKRRFIVCGGQCFEEIDGEIFNTYLWHGYGYYCYPDNKEWYELTLTGDIPNNITGATVSVDGDLLILCGGFTHIGRSNLSYSLDFVTHTWKLLMVDANDSQKPSPRDKLCSWIHNHCFYIFGGYGPNINTYLNDFGQFVFDESENEGNGWNNQLMCFKLSGNGSFKWNNIKCEGQIPSARAAHASTLINNNVYIFGGRHVEHRLNDLYSLCLYSMQFTQIITGCNSIPEGRSWHSLSSVNDNTLVVVGGYSQNRKPLDDVWCYNLTSECWVRQRGLTQGRLWHSAQALDSYVYIYGGCLSDVLSNQQQLRYSNDFIKLHPVVSTLKDLCFECVLSHFNSLKSQLDIIPQILIKEIRYRQK